MKQYIEFIFICSIFITSNLLADSAYQHFNTDELKLANKLIKGMKTNDVTYKEYLDTHKSINEALSICKNGLKQRLKWDDENQGYTLEENVNANKYQIGSMVFEFLERTKTVIMFTDGFCCSWYLEAIASLVFIV